jgi:hypothetical protein
MLPSSTEIEDAMALDAKNDGVIDVDFEIPDGDNKPVSGVEAVKQELAGLNEPPDDIDLPTEEK